VRRPYREADRDDLVAWFEAGDAAAQLHDLIRWRTRGYDEMSGEMSGVVSYHRASKVGWSNIRKKSDKIFY
jgi:hypothetical protein